MYEYIPAPWLIKSCFRKCFEFFRCDRFSKPAYDAIEEKLDVYFKGPGFFVEAGAVDGYFESNTYYLERFKGWSGILVEPAPQMFRRLSFNRPRSYIFNCALVSFDHQSSYISLRYNHALSSVCIETDLREDNNVEKSGSDCIIRVPARTLQSILEEVSPSQIDLLSLDVDGYEGDVLDGIDFQRFLPRYILIECLDDTHKRIIDNKLCEFYEYLEPFSDRDFFYGAKE